MTKQVKQLDRVIIRFAGDSGDGMQLTGDRFTQETATFGNDLSTLPNFPAEIRAPAGTLPGVSSFQVHFADHDILTPGDSPDVLVAMNPAALKANLGDIKPGATIIVDTHDFTARNLNQGRLRREPAGDRRARRVRRARVRPDRHDGRGGQGVRAVPQGRRPREEHVRARPAVVDVRPPDGADDHVPRAAVREGTRHPRRQHHRVQGRLELRRDHRGVRRPVRDQAGADGVGHLPQHHRQPRAGLRAGRRVHPVGPAAVPRLLPDHPGLRHPPRAEQAQAVRRDHVPGRGRDRRRRRGPRRRVRRRARRDHHVRPRHRAEVRDDRPRR